MGLDFSEAGGKHPYRFTREGCRPFPVPAHNGLKSEVTDVYLRSLCRNFGLDFETFKKHL
jgi:hypothetical protein